MILEQQLKVMISWVSSRVLTFTSVLPLSRRSVRSYRSSGSESRGNRAAVLGREKREMGRRRRRERRRMGRKTAMTSRRFKRS